MAPHVGGAALPTTAISRPCATASAVGSNKLKGSMSASSLAGNRAAPKCARAPQRRSDHRGCAAELSPPALLFATPSPANCSAFVGEECQKMTAASVRNWLEAARLRRKRENATLLMYNPAWPAKHLGSARIGCIVRRVSSRCLKAGVITIAPIQSGSETRQASGFGPTAMAWATAQPSSRHGRIGPHTNRQPNDGPVDRPSTC
jgi:hypothetical protein